MLSMRNVVISAFLGTTLALGSTGCSVKFNKKILPSASDLGIKTDTSTPPSGPTKLAITGSTADLASTCSAAYTVTSETSAGTPLAVPADATVTLSGNGAGTYYSDAACTLAITSVTIPSGSSSATFYFKDATFQSLTFTAATTGLTSGTLPVTIVANLPDAAFSTISVSPSSLTANGTSTSTVTITLLDSSGNPVVGVIPQFASTGTGNTLVQAVTATNASGVATGTIASTKAETKTLDISSPSGLTADTTTITFVPGPVDAAHSTIAASPTSVTADGSTTSTITMTLKDANGNPISGVTPQFASTGTGNTLVQPSSATNASGQATGTIASTKAETKTLDISSPAGLTSVTTTVTFTAGAADAAQSTIAISTDNITTDGGATTTVTITLKDVNGNPISGVTPQFASTGTGNTLVQPSSATNASGQATGTIASTKAQTKTLDISSPAGLTGVTTTVTFVPGSADLAHSIVTVSAATITSGGTSTLTLTAKDANSNPLTAGGLTIAFTFLGGVSAGTIGSVTDNNNGTYTAILTGSTSGTASTVHATIGGSAVTSSLPTVTVGPGSVSLAQSLVSVSAATIASGGTSTLTLTAKDAAGNQLTGGGLTVAFTFSGGVSSGTIGSVTDNLNGTYTATLTGTTAGSASTVSATIGGSAVTSSLPTVTVNPGAVNAAHSTIAVSSNNIPADGTTTTTVTITLKDVNDNPISGVTPQFASTGTGNTLVQPASATNASGQATGTIASSVIETKTLDISSPAGLTGVTTTVTFITNTPAVLSITPSTFDFGGVKPGTSVSQQFTITNSGGATATSVYVAVTAGDTTDFIIGGGTNNCGTSGSTVTVNGSASCTFYVQYTASAGTPGTTANTTVTATYNNGVSGGQTATATVVGNSSALVFSLNPNPPTSPIASYSYGSVNQGGSSSTITFKISNTSAATNATVAKITLGGTNAADFVVTQGTGACKTSGSNTQNKSTSCTFTVRYAPTTTGAETATVTLTYTLGSAQTVVLNLSGTGVAPPSLGFSPALKNYSTVAVSSSSAPQTFTLTNSGGSPSTGVYVTLSDTTNFTLSSNGCGTAGSTATLASGGNCTLQVTYSPQSSGTKTATLVATYNANSNGITTIASLIGSDGVTNPACTFAETTYNAHGSGTSGSPYILCTPAQLTNLMSQTGAALSKSYKLGANIDLNGASGVQPIAKTSAFTGTFDGAGYAVLNYSYTSGTVLVAFIERLYDPAVIENLNLLNVSVYSTSGNYGGAALVGDTDSATSNVRINNCAVTGTVTTTAGPYPRAGGLVASAQGMTISHSSFTGSVIGLGGNPASAGVYAGGIIGSAADSTYPDVTISASYANATVSFPGGWGSVGGLIGSCDNTSACAINNSYFTGAVIGDNGGTAGMVGSLGFGTGASAVSITNSYSSGNVYLGTDSMGGGLFGFNDNGTGVTITNSFSTGNVICNVQYGGTAYGGCGNVSDDLTPAIFAFMNSAYYSGAIVSNDGSYGTLAGTTGLTGQATLSSFYSSSNAPMSSWDFTTIWQDNSAANALPTLRTGPGTASVSSSTIAASPTSINIGGTSTLTLTAKDAAGNPMLTGGLTVAFTFSGGGSAGTIGGVTDNGNGTYTATLTGTTPGTASSVHATIGGSSVTSTLPTVQVAPVPASLANSTVTASPTSISSGGTSTLTLTAYDASNVRITSGGLTVAFTFSGGGSAGTIGSVTDNNDGTYTATLTGSTSGTASTVHATIGGSAVTSSLPTVTVGPGSVSLAQSLVSVSAATIASGGTSTLTLTAKDAAGNQLTSGGLTVAFTFSGGVSAGTIGSVTDNLNGTYTATLTGTTAGTASTVAATIGGSAVTSTLPTVTVTIGSLSLAQSTVSVSASPINSGSTSTITLTAKDAGGNQLSSGGLTVAFTFSGGGSAGTISSITDNNNGTYTATLTGTTSGSASTVHATIGGSTVTSTMPTVTVNPGTAAKLAFTTQPGGSVSACANFATQPVVVVQDAVGNTVTGSSATVALGAFTNSGCSTGATGALSNGSVAASSGVATFTAASFNSGATIYLQATSTSLTSACSTGTVTVTAPTKTIAIATGGTQSGTPYLPLATTLGVTVTDSCGAVFANEPVTWTLSNSSAGSVNTSSASSDTNGKVYGEWYFGTIPGVYSLQASIASGPSVTFNGTSIQGAWTDMASTNSPSARYGSASVWTGSKLVVWGGYDGTTYKNDGGIFDPVANSWTAGGITTTNAPTARAYMAAVWTGSKMIVWGGYDGTNYLADGGLYDPVGNSWTAGGTNATGAPTARAYQSSIWTGSQMIMYGGQFSGGYRGNGYAYDPSGSGTWSALNVTGNPSGRISHTAVWTGRRMIIWGGYDGTLLSDGAVYDTVTGNWTAITSSGAPAARRDMAADWTGSKMILWGGFDGTNYLGDGGSYDPVGDAWTSIASGSTNELSGRSGAIGYWTGSAFMIWGGYNSTSAYLGDMGFYDPVAGKWGYNSDQLVNNPSGRNRPQVAAAWTGQYLLIWGGNNGGAVGYGSMFDPQPVSTNAWKAIASTGAPTARDFASAVWTGSKMMIWGGGSNLNTGALFDPAANSWSPTSTAAPVPAGRYGHTAIWTGSKAVIWGGMLTGAVATSTGGMYDPIGDSWVATSATTPASSRYYHTSVWTGSKMLVFGGQNGSSSARGVGAMFDPSNGASGTWTAMSATNAPSARSGHGAVWTGSKMIIWGGQNTTTQFGDGYVFDPSNGANGTWNASVINATGAPGARSYPAVVWTGSKMLVWGGCAGNFNNSQYCAGSGTTAGYNDGALYDPTGDSWTPMSGTNAPTPRDMSAYAWTTAGFFTWSGDNNLANSVRNDGGLYNATTDTWTKLPVGESGEMIGRQQGIASVWTGARMLIWGGATGTIPATYADGAIVDPAGVNPWKAVTTSGAPAARNAHTAVWTGSKMIIWGGATANNATIYGDGGMYDPVADSWTSIPAGSANEPVARLFHTAVWTGSRMIISGGWDGTNSIGTGGLFDPETGNWTSMTAMDATVSARDKHTAVWTGALMLVWGGENGGVNKNSGAAYNPTTDSWTALATATQPTARINHTAVWTGSKLIVWGGNAGINTGGVLDLSNGLPGTWTATSTTSAPVARAYHVAVWTGTRMVVFGGLNTGGNPLNSGGLFDPTAAAASAWTATASVGKDYPSDASNMNAWNMGPVAVWTGSRMIVWGGDNLGSAANGVSRGIIYNPFTNTWTKTGYNYTNYPVDSGGGGRVGHTLVWTGSQLIMWGGCTIGTGPGNSCTGGVQGDGGIFTPFYTP